MEYEICGEFKKYKSKFVTYDNGEYLRIKIVSKYRKFDFSKFKENIRKSPIIFIYENKRLDTYYCYSINNVKYETDEIFILFYDYRIHKAKDMEAKEVRFYSKHINAMNQNAYFFSNLEDKDKYDDSKFLHNEQVDINNRQYELQIKNKLNKNPNNDNSINYISVISIKSKDNLENEEIYNLYQLVSRFLKFATFDKDSDIEHCEAICYTESIKCEVAFEFYCPTTTHNFKNETFCMPFYTLFGNMNNIINLLKDDFLLTDHILNWYYPINSLMFDLCAWSQYTFRQFAKSIDEYEVKKINITYKIDGKPKKVSLKEMLDWIINYSKDFVDEAIDNIFGIKFIINDKNEYMKNITERIKNFRNNLCHGGSKNSENYYPEMVLDCKIMYMYLYGAILKKCDLSKENTIEALEFLFRFF